MITPPKARRFHGSVAESVKPGLGSPEARPDVARAAARQALPNATQIRAEKLKRFTATEEIPDGFEGMAPAKAAGPGPAKGDPDARLDAIRAEKLTDRQLRIARRIAQLHKIDVASGEEAVLRLRERGIDPSHRGAVGQILSSEGQRAQSEPAPNPPAIRAQPPAPVPGDKATPNLPSREQLTEDRRAAEIYRIQQDIARRRRRRLTMLAVRLTIFVFVPTAVVGWYYSNVASPLFATESQFQIQSADSSGSGGGIGAALAGAAMSTNTDAVAVQSYLTSRNAMLRLDQDHGFKRAFQDPSMDPVQRLPADASNEEAFGVYRDSVKIGYDPTEGVLNMKVIAPSPELSEEFSRALISYAEQQVDTLTSRLRSDQMDGAAQSYEDAEAKMLAAQIRVQELQEQLGVLDPAAESGVVMGQVSALEAQLTEKQLELGQLLANPSPVQSRVDAVRGDITRLRALIQETRTALTQGSEERSSLAAVAGRLRVAEAELATRQELLAAAAAQMETARIEANKQVRYLSISVAPIPPDEATYPKAFQNTIVALLIFSGIYLMLSLTASILREQVST
ncbi:capsule biosynthesis protein [Paracoccus sp. 1_MG-2023]|uniref:capsule biosynthesis protein n=1 Tax=unclassified Paracoccus (in: a-proteobacteria) TaxID=2688777 RepID=UPI001C08334B|nr:MULTISPECIES: capsule biosynthesis protein [unclassified Paracoccus (in: a-proteobacteria)]MBU2956528.1 capsule biosynthesis protein [Paracoccus sp. C2R09]MDO6670412.1 capsule biosynthesis protein [Paracoccus sp. 1_MG-2023]